MYVNRDQPLLWMTWSTRGATYWGACVDVPYHTHSWGFSPPNEAKAAGPGGDWQRTSSFNGRSSFTGPTNFDL